MVEDHLSVWLFHCLAPSLLPADILIIISTIVVVVCSVCVDGMCVIAQGHVFAMEISNGEKFYIACDNTGTPLAVFTNNGLLMKQMMMSVLDKKSKCVCSVYLSMFY